MRSDRQNRALHARIKGMSTKDYIQYKMEQEIRASKAEIQHKYRMKYGDDILD